jgi:hypothetical protein
MLGPTQAQLDLEVPYAMRILHYNIPQTVLVYEKGNEQRVLDWLHLLISRVELLIGKCPDLPNIPCSSCGGKGHDFTKSPAMMCMDCRGTGKEGAAAFFDKSAGKIPVPAIVPPTVIPTLVVQPSTIPSPAPTEPLNILPPNPGSQPSGYAPGSPEATIVKCGIEVEEL